jgi:hypothetical protein
MFRFLRRTLSVIGLGVVLTATGLWDPPDAVRDVVIGALDDDHDGSSPHHVADVIPSR